MKVVQFVCLAVGALLVASAACAREVTIVTHILGPEGPLYLDSNLYYVGWVSNTLSKWDGHATTVLNSTPGCGHDGLVLVRSWKST